MGRQKTPFCRSWYEKRLKEYFESDFLHQIGATASDYLYAAEQIELVQIEAQAKEKIKKYKEEHRDLTKLEAFDYFRKLSVTNPLKYEKVLDMLGIEKGMSLHQIMFGDNKKGDK